MTNAKRFLLDVELTPATGDRFQPTGFPDLDAARFDRYDRDTQEWVGCLVVESAQSMANRLEGTAWDPLSDQPVDTFTGLPYVRVVRDDDDSYVTSSRTEAPRLASGFTRRHEHEGRDPRAAQPQRRQAAGSQRDRIGRLRIGPLLPGPRCVLCRVGQGVARPTQDRSGHLGGDRCRRPELGGVKKDHVRHSIGDTGGSSEGYGTIPFHRTEWTARQIVASFSIDRRQIRSYGLSEDATALLDAIARWEIAALLAEPLRLRTACDLEPVSDEFIDRSGEALASLESIDAEVRAGITACADLLGGGGPIEVRWASAKREKKA